MALLSEEFERCERCGGGYFEIKKIVLVQKYSPSTSPVHYKEREHYHCENCGHVQYKKEIL